MMIFAIASLMPAILLLAACLWGGVWAVGALLAITVVVFFLDKISTDINAPSEATGHGVSAALGVMHFALLAAVVWAVGAGVHLDLLDKILIITAAGLWFGQVSNSNAHELIHRSTRWPRRLGVAIYSSLLFGHHASAHPRVHHIHAATDKDPNSARSGEGFYRFALRAWTQSFTQGLRAENMARARASRDMPGWQHPYIGYCVQAALTLGAAAWLAGLGGVITLLLVAGYATLQLLLSDYVQHYGLRRRILADGKPEPIGPRHAWNAPQWYSSAMMLNAPRHSDHHMHPGRAFPALVLDDIEMPTLPHSLPVMAVVALIPPVWKRIMKRRVARWMSDRPDMCVLGANTAQEVAPAAMPAAH